MHNWVAIAVRKYIRYKLIDDFETNMIGITVETEQGNIDIVTSYIPPRDSILFYPDYYRILKSKDPVNNIFGDLSARDSMIGNRDNNTRGNILAMLINRGHAQRLGPTFPTYLTHRSATSHDIILANNRVFHNTHSKAGTHLTSSDHIYIVFAISASPIQIPIKKRDEVRRADWDRYGQILGAINTSV